MLGNALDTTKEPTVLPEMFQAMAMVENFKHVFMDYASACIMKSNHPMPTES